MFSKSFTAFITTWNLGREQPGRDLKEWIPLGKDLYCVCVQESDFKPRAPFKIFHEEWFDIINSHLGADYSVISHISGSHVTISIHVKKSFLEHIKDTQTSYHQITDTKGGVGIGVFIDNISLCFISAHLAAHQFAFEDRNRHMNEIEKGLNFSGKSVHNFDHIFVAGDLNYRIVGFTWDDGLKLITTKEYAKMLECDQLKKEREANKVLVGYQEGPILFAPTFKMLSGTNADYSPKTADPAGTAYPSYCDRILWKSNSTQSTVKQNLYTSAPTITYSDHKPVLAIFTIEH